jgi:hypothetical protein
MLTPWRPGMRTWYKSVALTEKGTKMAAEYERKRSLKSFPLLQVQLECQRLGT